jgi:hypothetical protein
VASSHAGSIESTEQGLAFYQSLWFTYPMDRVLRYRGRDISTDDVTFVNELIADHAGASRRELSIRLCKAWGWLQPNGTTCDAVCRGLLLELHRAGHIQLPPPQWVSKKAAARNRPPAPVAIEPRPLHARLSEIGSVEIRQVRRTADEALVNSLVEQHHYLRYTRPVGEHLKYLVSAGEHPIACFFWSSAPRHLGPRDRHIGWSQAARKANIRLLAYQTRFLILPWVQVPHLASHLLGRMSRQLSADWQRVYAHPIFFVETFVDPQRYRGTCYRAANWSYLGITTGRGKDDQTRLPNRSQKMVFGYPLARDYRRLLCSKG